ncbi:hypothetical protein B0H12DRAFT_1195782 [Mycena haematopus]|nr:hypothetical protein B0H12DRAFT_1195782 [Mycena haematopus]
MSTEGGPSNPTPGSSGSVNPPPIVPEWQQRVASLETTMGAILASLQAVQADRAASTVQPLAQTNNNPPPLVVTPPVAAPQFTPPIAPLNSAAGASPSLDALFPDVKPACITAVITHDLEASELYKLDRRIRDSQPTWSLSAEGSIDLNTSKHKAYKNLNSILVPMTTYFAILTAHLPARAPPVYFYRYISHLAMLAPEYEWAAVLEYHIIFFNRRRSEMSRGSYEGWATADIELLSSFVYPHRKQVNPASGAKPPKRVTSNPGTDACRNFNAGKCESPCAWKRPHVCSSPGCGKDHPLTQHK